MPGEFIDAMIGGEARRAYLAVPEAGRSTGCCPAFRRPGAGSNFRRGDRQFPRQQALSRAHLLGSGERARADRAARSRGAAGRRGRDREKAARRDPAIEYLDEALGGERPKGAWRYAMTIDLERRAFVQTSALLATGAAFAAAIPSAAAQPANSAAAGGKAGEIHRQAAAFRSVEDKGPVGEDPGQPLRQQLHRRRQPAQRDRRAARRARFCQGAGLPDQRAKTRRVDRDEFDDIA